MSNPETAVLTSELGELERVQNFIRLILDARACGKRAEELQQLTVQTIEAKAAAEAARAGLAEEQAKRFAEIEAKRAELDQAWARWKSADDQTKRDRQQIEGWLQQYETIEQNIKSALMAYGGLLQNFQPRIQEMPSMHQLLNALRGTRDPHMDADPVREAAGSGLGNEAVEHAPEGSTLTRSRRRDAA
jgi:small-conductance mechanosensitive channel